MFIRFCTRHDTHRLPGKLINMNLSRGSRVLRPPGQSDLVVPEGCHNLFLKFTISHFSNYPSHNNSLDCRSRSNSTGRIMGSYLVDLRSGKRRANKKQLEKSSLTITLFEWRGGRLVDASLWTGVHTARINISPAKEDSQAQLLNQRWCRYIQQIRKVERMRSQHVAESEYGILSFIPTTNAM